MLRQKLGDIHTAGCRKLTRCLDVLSAAAAALEQATVAHYAANRVLRWLSSSPNKLR